MFINPIYARYTNPSSFFSITTTAAKVLMLYRHLRDSFALWGNYQKTKGYLLYSKLSLIAEVGGYVGLFLGVSVNQIINLMEHVILKIEQLQSDSWSDICTYNAKRYEFTTHIIPIIYT